MNEPSNTNGSSANDNGTNGTLTNGDAQTANRTRRRKAKSTGLAALIEEAEALKKALHDAYARSHLLLRATKRQRKQTQIVQSTLRNLKELQAVGE